MRPLLLSLTLLLCLPATLLAAPEQWTEVRSPHFRVLTDGSAHDGEKVAGEFEQMRYVFEKSFPKITLDSGAPLTIVAGRDATTIKQLLPEFWKVKNASNVAGVFSHGWEKQFVWVRLDQWGEGAHQVVYHEYTHSVLHMNLRWMPTWMDEGLAEYYGYTRFQSHKIYVGAPTERFRVLQSRPLIPLETLLEVDGRSPYYHDPDKVQMFYAESWALVHYMIFGPDMEKGEKLQRFYLAMQNGMPQKQAFTSIFGDPKALGEKLQLYVSHFAFSASIVPAPAELDEHSYVNRKLSVAETEAEIGAFEVGAHEPVEGHRHLQAALAADPNLGLAHEEDGFLLFRAGKDAEALSEFQKAYALDSKLYRSLWAATMMGPEPKTVSEVQARRTALYKVLATNQKFAPVWVELALMDMASGDTKSALDHSRMAEALEPGRAGYHLLSARILLATGRKQQAAEFARFVADRWYGPDHNEAVEIWNQIPVADRPAGLSLAYERPEGSEQATGTLAEVKCASGPGEELHLALDSGGKSLTFVAHGSYEWDYSDTLWYGADHATICHHLEGRRAVIYYRPGGNAGVTGQMLGAEFRVDPPPQVAQKEEAESAAPATATTAQP